MTESSECSNCKMDVFDLIDKNITTLDKVIDALSEEKKEIINELMDKNINIKALLELIKNIPDNIKSVLLLD